MLFFRQSTWRGVRKVFSDANPFCVDKKKYFFYFILSEIDKKAFKNGFVLLKILSAYLKKEPKSIFTAFFEIFPKNKKNIFL